MPRKRLPRPNKLLKRSKQRKVTIVFSNSFFVDKLIELLIWMTTLIL
ncbi:hypothetical protein TELCIR_26261 [Teladorsagia circumcincta]|uniref:Uncharacterized protein n=1 Tax=Teladorsagia circumcincta TaxID=45464 RepID=A0A2G9T3B8_TELCI|nr:hypothetical protein TELCIR_26261 [Teladorsagia circumcincta]